MRKHALLLLGLVAGIEGVGCTKAVIEESQPLGLEPWAASFEGDSYMYGNAIASGPDGDLFLAGTFTGGTDLGGGALIADEQQQSAVFVAHLDEGGNHLFSGSTGYNDSVSSVAIGPDGDLYVGGYYDGAINFGTGKLTGYKNGYVAAFDRGGASEWSLALGGEAEDWVDDVTVTPSGNVVVAARAADDTDFGDGAVVIPYTQKQAVIASYDRTGNHLWDVRIPNADHSLLSVASDAAGDVIVVGRSYNDIQIIGESGDPLQSAAGSFVAKISADGTPLWLAASSSSDTYPDFYDAAVGPDGSIFVAGNFYYGSFSIGGMSSGFSDDSETFWLRLSPDGAGLHLHRLGTPNYYGLPQLAVAPNGDVLLGLTTYYAVDFGGGQVSFGPGQNAVLARFTPEGQHIRSMEIPGTSNEYGQSNEYLTDIAADPDGNTVVLGWFDAEMEIGGTKLSSTTGNTMFVARMAF
jgi:hypothetical protein